MSETYFISYRCGEIVGNCKLGRRKGKFSVKEAATKIEKLNNFKKGSVIILFFKRFEKGESYK